MEDRYSELLARVERGERELRAMRRRARGARWLALSAVMGACAFLLTRPAATQSAVDAFVRGNIGIRIKGPLIVTDDAGRPIVQIGANAVGRGLALWEGSSADGSATGRGLTVFDPSEKAVGLLGLGKNGTNQGRGLTVNDGTGAPVAGLGVWPQRPDRGQLVLTDREQNPVFAQPALP
jgi:hypothetical protein